jgi:hypothetical protein
VYFAAKGGEIFGGRGWIVLQRGLIAVALGVLGLLERRRVNLLPWCCYSEFTRLHMGFFLSQPP